MGRWVGGREAKVGSDEERETSREGGNLVDRKEGKVGDVC